VSVTHRSPNRGFTLGETLIAVALSMVVMAAVLSSYVFIARSYTRTIGFGQPNQPTLESQDRRTLSYFVRDVHDATAITSPSSSEVTLTVPRPTGGTKNITYYYNSSGASATPYGTVSIPDDTLMRIDRSADTGLTMHGNLLTCVFSYYDDSGNGYTAFTDFLIGIKQIQLTFTSQSGTAANGTLTQVYKIASPRMVIRNLSYLP
jgi:hypothetical protein